METKTLIKSLLIAPVALFASSAMAIPSLQIGDADGGVCESYDFLSEDCIVGGTFTVTSDMAGAAYIVFSAVPKSLVDTFQIFPSGDEGGLTNVEEGYGAPPFSDPNSLAPHGIFDTWSEVYRIDFNSPGTVVNTTPGSGNGSIAGWIETVDINIYMATSGIHIDLFRCSSGMVEDDDCQITKGTDFAPFSHDASVVPVPAAVWLFGSGLLGLVGVARRRR